MPTKYYRNVETEEVVTLAEGDVDVYEDQGIEGTTNKLYREISAVEAGAYVAPEDVVSEPVEAPVDEAPAEEAGT